MRDAQREVDREKKDLKTEQIKEREAAMAILKAEKDKIRLERKERIHKVEGRQHKERSPPPLVKEARTSDQRNSQMNELAKYFGETHA